MQTQIKRILINWGLHFILAWIGIILFTMIPYLYHVQVWGNYIFNTDGTPVDAWQYFSNHIGQLWIVALFLLFTEFIYQFLFKKVKLILFILSCFLTAVCSFMLLLAVNSGGISLPHILTGIQIMLFMAAYAFSYAMVREFYEQFQRKKSMRLQQLETELHALKAQLNPHFLFNTLNYLYGTALKEESPATAEGIDRLSEMMRYTITGMEQNHVPLIKELDFIAHYISLQKVRVSESQTIETEIYIQPDQHQLLIGPLLLLPFIENAFKYGISIDHPGIIEIRIKAKEAILTMEVSNKIIMHSADSKGNQTGIKNTIKRLDLLYPDRYKLEFDNQENIYSVCLTLHLSMPGMTESKQSQSL